MPEAASPSYSSMRNVQDYHLRFLFGRDIVMNLHAGGELFFVLVVIHLLWDWRHGSFRGIALQILGALSLGTILNAIVNPHHNTPYQVRITIIVYGVLLLLFYWWAWVRRHRKNNWD